VYDQASDAWISVVTHIYESLFQNDIWAVFASMSSITASIKSPFDGFFMPLIYTLTECSGIINYHRSYTFLSFNIYQGLVPYLHAWSLSGNGCEVFLHGARLSGQVSPVSVYQSLDGDSRQSPGEGVLHQEAVVKHAKQPYAQPVAPAGSRQGAFDVDGPGEKPPG